MKKSIISYLTSRRLKRLQATPSLGYRHAQRVAVLINTEEKWQGLDQFFHHLKADNKQLSSIYYYGKNDPAEAGQKAYHPTDISLFGSLKSEVLQDFVSLPYDYCFILDRKPHPYIDFIAAQLKCQTTIGFVYTNGNYLADLQIKPDHGRELTDLLRYTKQLS